MGTQPESKASREIRGRLPSLLPGSFWFKIAGGQYQSNGVSDNLGVVLGILVCIEMKMRNPKNKKHEQPTALQLNFIDNVNKSGGIAFTYIYDPLLGYQKAAEEVAAFINEILTNRATFLVERLKEYDAAKSQN